MPKPRDGTRFTGQRDIGFRQRMLVLRNNPVRVRGVSKVSICECQSPDNQAIHQAQENRSTANILSPL